MPQIIALIVSGGAILVLSAMAGTPAGRRQLGAIAASMTVWAVQGLFALAPTIAVTFATGLLTAFSKDRELWAKVTAVFIRELTGGTLDEAALVKSISSGGLKDAAPAVAGPIIDIVRQVIAPKGLLTPEQGQRNLSAILGLNILLGLQGWWVSAAADLVSLGKFGAAADLPDTLDRAVGLSRIARLAWRTPVKKAIAEPLEVLYNRAYQFTRLTMGEALKAYHAGKLTDDEFIDRAADAGYNHDRAKLLLSLTLHEWDPAQIQELWRFGGLPETDAVGLLRAQGWGRDRAVTFWGLLKGAIGRAELKTLADTARRLYKAGDLSEQEFRDYLAAAHYQEDEIALALAVEQLALREEKQLTATQLIKAYHQGTLDPLELRARLRKQHYDDPDIDLLIALEQPRLSAGQLAEAFARGGLTRDEATGELERLGYTADQAALLLALRSRQLTEGQVLDALRHNLINRQDAQTQLERLGFELPAIEVLLAFQAKTLSPADVQAAVLRGFLTTEQATARLVASGYSAADAALIVQLRRRLLTTGEVIDAYGDALIARVDALGDLQARGLSPGDAQAVVTMFDRKHQAAQARAAAAAAKAAAGPEAPPPAAP